MREETKFRPPSNSLAPSLADLHAAFEPFVRTLLRRRARPADVDDLVQSSFIQIGDGLPRYDPARPIQPWIATIVFRTARRHIRREVLKARAEDRCRDSMIDPGCEERVEAREELPQLLACLKKRQLEIVLRILRDEESIAVVSQELGISTDGGYKLLQTAIAHLRAARARAQVTERRQLGTMRAREVDARDLMSRSQGT